jgi:hypothetical protein
MEYLRQSLNTSLVSVGAIIHQADLAVSWQVVS